MKTTSLIKWWRMSIATALLPVFALPALAADTYQLDPAHTSVVFKVKHLGVTNVYGRFNGPTGTFVFDEASPARSSIDIQVNAKNVDTAVEKRDNHLRSPDFFNVTEHPLISFKSRSVKKVAKDTYEVSGDLSLLGKTRPITITARQTGQGNDPWGKFRRGSETNFTIKRSEFGMDFMMGGVSDEVGLTVSVTGIRQ